MTLLTTTTITVYRPAEGDPYESAALSVVAEGVAAHISSPSGAERDIGGSQTEIDAVLLADTLDLNQTDQITDERGDTYRVAWVRHRVGLGLDHTKAGLKVFQGASNG